MGWAQIGSWVHRGQGLPCPVHLMLVEQGQCVPTPNTGSYVVGGVARTQAAAASEDRVGVSTVRPSPSTVCPGIGFARGHVSAISKRPGGTQSRGCLPVFLASLTPPSLPFPSPTPSWGGALLYLSLLPKEKGHVFPHGWGLLNARAWDQTGSTLRIGLLPLQTKVPTGQEPPFPLGWELPDRRTHGSLSAGCPLRAEVISSSWRMAAPGQGSFLCHLQPMPSF